MPLERFDAFRAGKAPWWLVGPLLGRPRGLTGRVGPKREIDLPFGRCHDPGMKPTRPNAIDAILAEDSEHEADVKLLEQALALELVDPTDKDWFEGTQDGITAEQFEAFSNMHDQLTLPEANPRHRDKLTEKQRAWVRSVLERNDIVDERTVNLVSRGLVPRGREVEPALALRNRPLKPPGVAIDPDTAQRALTILARSVDDSQAVPACPKCKGPGSRLHYGLVRGRDRDRVLRSGAVLGGCMVSEDSPRWVCKACRHTWGRVDDPAS